MWGEVPETYTRRPGRRQLWGEDRPDGEWSRKGVRARKDWQEYILLLKPKFFKCDFINLLIFFFYVTGSLRRGSPCGSTLTRSPVLRTKDSSFHLDRTSRPSHCSLARKSSTTMFPFPLSGPGDLPCTPLGQVPLGGRNRLPFVGKRVSRLVSISHGVLMSYGTWQSSDPDAHRI